MFTDDFTIKGRFGKAGLAHTPATLYSWIPLLFVRETSRSKITSPVNMHVCVSLATLTTISLK